MRRRWTHPVAYALSNVQHLCETVFCILLAAKMAPFLSGYTRAYLVTLNTETGSQVSMSIAPSTNSCGWYGKNRRC